MAKATAELGVRFEGSVNPMNKIFFLLLSIILTSCTVPVKMQIYAKEPTKKEINAFDSGVKTTQYKKAIKSYMKDKLFDPYSVKFENYSIPKKDWVNGDEARKLYIGWLVCVDINAKNRYGAYTGSKRNYFIFKGNNIIYTQDHKYKSADNGWKKPKNYLIACKY